MKKWYYIVLVVSFLGIVVCFGLQALQLEQTERDKDLLREQMDALKVFETTESNDAALPDDTTEEASDTTADTADPAVSTEPATESTAATQPGEEETTVPDSDVPENEPVQEQRLDFKAMQEVNPDIHAWLKIDGLKLDYPVLQHPTEDEWYLRRAYDKSDYIGGCLFTQCSYNAVDCNDPVTVIYGHTMRSGAFFGELQKVYTDEETFSQYSDITLYLPGEVRHYTVFAAVPYDNIHILHTYDFTNEYWFNSFFKNVFEVRALGAQFDPENKPVFGDRVIILSTCLNQDSTQRFLVMARLATE